METKQPAPIEEDQSAPIKPKSTSRVVAIAQIIFAIVLPNLGGMVGALVTTSSIDSWYPFLEKPSWNPPNWLFAPMWVLLYTLIGIASYLVYRFGGGLKGPAKWCLLIYLINLALNWSWSPVFFNNQDILGAFILIIFVLATAISVAVSFAWISWTAGGLVVPYVIWLTIATALNGWIYVNNK